MSNKILLSRKAAVFEPHLFTNRSSPFIMHDHFIKEQDYANFHESLELLYFISGTGTVQCDNTLYRVKAGDLLVVNSFTVHQIFATQNLRRFCLIISNSFCELHRLNVSKLYFTPFIQDPVLQALLQKLHAGLHRSIPFQALEESSTVLQILLNLCQNYSRERPLEKTEYIPNISVSKAIEYVKENLAKKLTVDLVAAHVSLSKYHFSRKFKKYTGYTLANYINIIRCEYAKELLKTGENSIKTTAYLCGFQSPSYFTNVFKKHTGLQPSEFLNTKKP